MITRHLPKQTDVPEAKIWFNYPCHCDALATHGAGARASPGTTLAACWAHSFRKFEEAKPDHPEADKALGRLGALYEIDWQAEGNVLRATKVSSCTRSCATGKAKNLSRATGDPGGPGTRRHRWRHRDRLRDVEALALTAGGIIETITSCSRA